MTDTPKAGSQSFQSSLIQKEKHRQLVPKGSVWVLFFLFNMECLVSDNINRNNISGLWFISTGIEYILDIVFFITDMLLFKC